MEPTGTEPADHARRHRSRRVTECAGVSGGRGGGDGSGRVAGPTDGRPTLGEALVRAADARGHDLRDAARALETSRGNVWQWVCDTADPCPEFFGSLMAYLGLTDDQLGGHILRSQIRRARTPVDRVAGRPGGRLDPAPA
jgi:hypothetical protein